ncbi:hypothetical protein BEWA_047290 [Theileria equi strain WA]|uniref:Uncharacterized protein n=1 Tax=Theileria equi strain WA TaxID=1537102 RepID=L1LAJ8_THEEQ|nr:hypothetical protein BEWA_047290 [Theileria equi strain WA]EKX72264.1 hypothetical protein BEWA_047290 [Theileria equi strain WA]|eukprot:XP_004831716.1 hypothetical protein BEWA_047290 [Theileria equi strain WA]
MDDGDRLKLNLENRCGEVRNRCTCPGYKPPGLETKKVTGDHNAVGFIAYTHSNKEGFTLSNNLGDGEKLEDEEVKKVTSVSVYYWDGDKNYDKPLLLEVKKKDDPKSFYYLRYDETETGDQPAVWKQYTDDTGTSLQALLDERNLGRNNVFPLYLDQPTKPLDVESNVAKSKGLELVKNGTEITGSDYRVTEYKLNGKDGNTRFSRVMHGKDRVNGITIPNDIISNIRLYSSPINNSKVPIMFEFVGKDGGNSKWFHNQNKGTGTTQWGEIGNPEGFHSDKNNSISTLTEKFTRKLDGLVCENYNGVTIDLSRNRSEGRSYCCEHHTGEKGTGKVSVKTEELALNGGVNKLPYYKHHIEAGQKVAGIKFYQDDNTSNRRKVSARSFKFPMEGPVDIYTFYSGNNPELIYVYGTGTSPPVKGWFRRDSSGYGATWKKTSHSLRSIKHKDIYEKRLNCTQWTALREILNKRDGNLEECQEPPRPQGSVARNDSDGVPEIGSEEDDEESADDSEHSKSTLSSPRLSPPGAPSTGKASRGDTPSAGKDAQTGPEAPKEPAPQALGVATAGAMSLGTISGISSGTLTGAGSLTGLGSLDLSFIRAVVEIL